MTFQELDFSNFHDQAIAVLQQIQQVELGSAVMRSVVDIFESVLGPITCDGVDPSGVIYWDANRPPSYFEDAECTWYILARYTDALHKEPGPDLRIELRTRPVRWPIQTFQHLSIYNPSEHRWVSAFPENGAEEAFEDNGGYLQAKSDEESDDPTISRVAAYLSLGSVGLSEQWSQVMGAKDSFDNFTLPYCILPDISLPFFPDCSGFNSNGWAIGLVDFVNFSIEPVVFRHVRVASGTSVVTLPVAFDPDDAFGWPGITVPVPSSHFQ